MRGITKRYGPVTANDKIDFSFERAGIHALLGENGAGKTTLMRILYGMTRADSGSIVLNGAPVLIRSPRDAINLNISMVHQHFMLADPLSVVENIVLGYEPRRLMFHDLKRALKETASLCERFSLKVNLKAPVGSITVGEKQRVEIIKALYRRSEIIILDEPTAVLTSLEVQEFFSVLRKLKEAGKTIIIITHKLKEVMSISDTVTVLCRGRWMSTAPTARTTSAGLAELMVGHRVSTAERQYGRALPHGAPVYLELKNITVLAGKTPKLRNLSLNLRSAEILGICGVEGNGQAELAETVTGLRSPAKGTIRIKGKPVEKAVPRGMLDLGVAHIPGDRAQDGLIRSLSVAGNIMLGYQRRPQFRRRGLIHWEAVTNYAKKMTLEFDIRAADVSLPVSSLSGGNQQKVVIARSLSQNPDIIIAVQPTRGVDIGAVEYIHEKLLAMRDAGKAILLISTEIDELLSLSDTIAVLYEGMVAAQGPAGDFDERRLALLMTGLGTGASGLPWEKAHGEG
jgi:simple sugar transport system ATP-binding protein